MEILYISLILFVAYFVRSVCGFGAGMIGVPLLVLFIDLPDVVVLLTLLTLITSSILVKKSWQKVDKKMVLSLMTGAIPMVLLGVYLLNSLESALILKILGVILVIFAANFLTEKDLFGFLRNKTAGFFAGLFSGLGGAMFSIAGPPVISYLSAIYKDPKIMRATLLAYFFSLNIIKVITYTFAGNIQKENLVMVAYMLPILLFATYLGHHVHLKIPDKFFKILIAVVMISSGISLIF